MLRLGYPKTENFVEKTSAISNNKCMSARKPDNQQNIKLHYLSPIKGLFPLIEVQLDYTPFA